MLFVAHLQNVLQLHSILLTGKKMRDVAYIYVFYSTYANRPIPQNANFQTIAISVFSLLSLDSNW